MSGGHFDYMQFRLEDIALMIEWLISDNDLVKSYGENGKQGRFGPDVLEKFRLTILYLRAAGDMTHRIDWLVSGDDDEDSFFRRWEEKVEPILKEIRKIEREKRN